MQRYVFILLFVLATSVGKAQSDGPTWADDIACIVHSHCTSCHNDNGVAPFPIETYQDMVAWESQILHEVVVERLMPPWQSSDPAGTFVGDFSMSEGEIQLLKEWYEDGMEMGDPNDIPEAPVFEAGPAIADPSYVIDIEPYEVPATNGRDLYRCFVFPVDFDSDKFITNIEFIPDNLTAVHHILLYHDTGNTAVNLDANDPEPGYVCFGGIGTNNARLLGGWAPGGDLSTLPEGMGIKIPGNTNLVVQIHYPFYSQGEVDASQIRFELADEVDREVRVDPILYHFPPVLTNGPISVPPNEMRTYNQETTIPGKITLLSVAPHAHLICTSMKSWMESPDGTTTQLVNLPRWDFEWQGSYGYQRPIIVEPNSKLFGEALYDNTVNNPNNPVIPPQHVSLGEETGDEMMLFFFSWIVYENGDENLVFGEADHHEHIDDCEPATVTGTDDLEAVEVSVYPNPVSDVVFLESDHSISRVVIFDALGEKVKELKANGLSSVNVSDLIPGSYVLQITAEERILAKQITINR